MCLSKLYTVCLMLFLLCYVFFFFFKQKTAYEMRISDWSSDVCSSDLTEPWYITIARREFTECTNRSFCVRLRQLAFLHHLSMYLGLQRHPCHNDQASRT